MRVSAITTIILLLGVTAAPAANPEKPGQYVKHTLGPKAVVMAATGAAVNQADDTPHEWGQGAAGFGRRFASGFGKHLVHKAIQYPIARLRHEEFSYHPSGKQGFGPRFSGHGHDTQDDHRRAYRGSRSDLWCDWQWARFTPVAACERKFASQRIRLRWHNAGRRCRPERRQGVLARDPAPAQSFPSCRESRGVRLIG
jgi:hypothetical protein